MTFNRRHIAIVVCSAALASCSYIHTEKALHAGADDWQMYGGGIGRVNVALNRIRPPLVKLWEYNAGGGFSGYSAAIVDSTLFIGTLIGEVHMINIATGKGIGTTDFGTAVVGTPIVDKDIVYIPLARDEESLVAYNVRLAKNEWQKKLGDIESSPLLLGDKLLVTTLRGKLVCLNKITGESIWTFEIPSTGHVSMIHSSPASDGNMVFFGSDNGNLYAVDVSDGKLRWKASTGGAIMSSPSVRGGKVYIGSLDQTYYAFDVTSGKNVWKQSLGANIVASQAVDELHVYVGTTGHVFYCLNKDDGTVVWKYIANSVFNAAPLVTEDIVYIGCTDKTLYAFETSTGELIWQFKTEGRIKTMPIAWKQYLVVLTEDDDVIAFTAENNK